MIKLSERERQLIFILIILLMFVLTFKFGFMNITDQADKLSEENITLNGQLMQLNKYVQKESEYKADIAELEKKSNLIKAKYGAGNTPEKTIMFLDTIEKRTGIFFNHISFGEMYLVGSKDSDKNQSVEIKPVGNTYLYCTPVTVNFTSSYDGLKKSIDMINNCAERMTIESFNCAYDMAVGKLSGSMTINMYEITGTDKLYYPPVIKDAPIGQPSPFGVN